MMGFPKGKLYTGAEAQKKQLEIQFLTKAELMYRFKTPIWNGEFGPVYALPGLDADMEKVNDARINVLGEQLNIYDKYKIHWSIWLYKVRVPQTLRSLSALPPIKPKILYLGLNH